MMMKKYLFHKFDQSRMEVIVFYCPKAPFDEKEEREEDLFIKKVEELGYTVEFVRACLRCTEFYRTCRGG